MRRAGRCLCGAVRYAVSGRLREILVCHCVECQRWAGRAWAATAARAEELDIDDESALAWVASPRSARHARRGFCRRCGSGLFWRARGSEVIAIAAGSLEDRAGLAVAAHIWVEQAASWEAPPPGAPTFPRGYPPDAPPLAWR
ncbi:MAG: GFA family protein [Thermoleophilia bacterium]|nr:GFA family protein [Gaiellaceae bacterium]MDW8339751.1 GFA family protein [Thermoleophilia bacterium]